MTQSFLRLVAVLAVIASAGAARAAERVITLASTTSTEQSGLFGYLLPIFSKDTGITVHVVAVGTGQALQIGSRGDADALLVHDRTGEEKFVADGFGIDRRDVMHNDFVVVGPAADPARIRNGSDPVAAMARIAAVEAPFASRGDDSGTHRMELRLWQLAGVKPVSGPGWYRSLGSGMGPTLNAAAAMEAYTLSDRATWANFKNRGSLVILVQGGERLLNPYSTILVNPARFPTVKAADAKIWHDWLTSAHGQAVIAQYKIGGEQLFFPDYAVKR